MEEDDDYISKDFFQKKSTRRIRKISKQTKILNENKGSKGMDSTNLSTKQKWGQVLQKGKHPLPRARYPLWNPSTLIRVDVNSRRGKLIFELPVTGPQVIEIH